MTDYVYLTGRITKLERVSNPRTPYTSWKITMEGRYGKRVVYMPSEEHYKFAVKDHMEDRLVQYECEGCGLHLKATGLMKVLS